MNTPDKCPHCGDPAIDGTEFWTEYDCGTTVCCKGEQLRSEYCKVNAELAATKRELAQASAECGIAHDQRRDEAHRAEKAEARVRELENMEILRVEHHYGSLSLIMLHIDGLVSMETKTLGEAMGGGK